MQMTSRELWTALHGIILGAVYLLAFSGGLVALLDFPSIELQPRQFQLAARRAAAWLWTMAILAWLTVLLGTYLIYPWYRAKPPASLMQSTSAQALADHPKYRLLADERTAEWHELGMEWKEHIAWLTPILATAVAFAVWRYPRALAADLSARRTLISLYCLAFVTASIAGLFGALLNKVAPVL